MNNKLKSPGKTKSEATMLVICLLLFSGCGMKTGAETAQMTADETLQSAVEENTVSINLDEMDALSDSDEKSEKYCAYLEQITIKDFADQEGIESAKAAVSYDEGTEQYSIEVSLETNGQVDSEQIEDYKTYLGKSFSAVTLLVDGEALR